MAFAIISKQAKDFIILHKNDRPRATIAKTAGVSINTLYRVLRENGAEMRYDLSQEHGAKNITIQYYPTMSAREIAAKFNIKKSAILRWSEKLKLKHTDMTVLRLKAKTNKALERGRQNIDYTATAKKRRIKRRIDELRFLSGKPQKTRFKFSSCPMKTYRSKWYLINRKQYCETQDPYILERNENTRLVNEGYYNRKYGIKFVEAG